MPDTALFTEAEARAFNNGILADAEKYPTAAITAKEAEIRAFFLDTCGVDFFPTTHSNEYRSGDGSRCLLVKWPLVTSITSASLRSGTVWTALTAGELGNIYIDPDGGFMLYREDGQWPYGIGNVKLTYVAGHAAVPGPIKDAALRIAVTELPATNRPFSADSYDAGGVNVSFAAGDGFNGAWHSIAEVRRAIRMYSRKLPGIA